MSESSDITSRPRETRDESNSDGIGDAGHDNWNSAGLPLGKPDKCVADETKTSTFSGIKSATKWGSFSIFPSAHRFSIYDLLSLHVPKFAQSLRERCRMMASGGSVDPAPM